MPFNGLAAQQLECFDGLPGDAGWQSPPLRRVLLRASISACAARLIPGSPGVRCEPARATANGGRRSCSAGKRSELYGPSVPARGALAPRTDATRWRYERLFLERLVRVPEKLA